jgi:hypothetical protein
MGPEGFAALLLTIQLAWKTKTILKDWEIAIIIPIFKKGNNHRGICLLSIPAKIYTRITEGKLRLQIEDQLEETVRIQEKPKHTRPYFHAKTNR